MCIFRATSKNNSFIEFRRLNPDFPVYKTHEKGERPGIGKEESAYEEYCIYCEVSDRDWQDTKGQVTDMISFLEVYAPFLIKLQKTHDIDDWRFDLPYECKLNETRFTQYEYLPPKLIKMAGALEIGIELSLYWPSEEEETDHAEVHEGGSDSDEI